jgi:hypothetical protein
MKMRFRPYTFFIGFFTWRLYIKMPERKAFRTFIRPYSLFNNERLRANIKLTLQ